MKITADSAALTAEIRRLSKLTADKGALPVLSNILFQAGATLELTATDLQVGMRTQCPVVVVEPGATTLPAKKLLEILEQLAGPVTITEEVGRVQVLAGTFRSRLQTLPAADFPAVPEPEGTVRTVAASDMRAMIARTEYAISDKSAAYVLKGALLSFFGEVFALVATDGKRLSIATAACAAGDAASAIIPTRTLDALAGHCDGRDLLFSTDGRHLFFQVGERLLYSQMLDGQFPSYERIIPRETALRASIDRLALQAALRRVGAVADEDRAVGLQFSEGALLLTTRSSTIGDAEEQIVIEYAGPPAQVSINGSYVLEFLEQAVQSTISVEWNPGSPLLFTDGPDFINVILGMRN